MRQLLAHLRLRLLGGIHHYRVPQPERVAQPVRQRCVEPGRQPDLNTHDAGRSRVLEDPCHLKPAHAELLGDLALGTAVDEETAGDAGRTDQLGRPEARERRARLLAHRLRLSGHESADRYQIGKSPTCTLDAAG